MLLAISAYLAGALPSGDPGAGFRTGWFAAVSGRFTVGLVCWLAGAIVLVWAWLRSPASSLRDTLLTGALWAVPLLAAPPLGSRDVYAYACQGWIWAHGADPYSAGVADGGCPSVSSVPELWWHTPTPYGPLAVALSGLLGNLIGLRLLAVAAAAVLAWQLPRLASLAFPVAHTPVGAHAVALRLGLVTPLVLVHGISGAHNDLLVAALLVPALALAASNKSNKSPRAAGDGAAGEATARDGAAGKNGVSEDGAGDGAAGKDRVSEDGAGDGAAGDHAWRGWAKAVAVGLLLVGAVGIKATALVGVPFALLLLRRRGWAGALSAAGAFAALSLVTGLGLGWIPALRNTGELAQWSSPPTAVGMAIGYVTGHADTAIAVTRTIALVALAAFAAWQLAKAWRGRHDIPTVIVACGHTLAATVLLGPVFYPWYAILPIAILATASRDAVTRKWLAPAIVVATFLVLPNGLGIPVLTKAVGAFAVTAVVIATLTGLYRDGRRPSAPVKGVSAAVPD